MTSPSFILLFARQHAARVSASTLIIGLLLANAALGASHNQLKELPVAMDQQLTAEIDAVLNDYEALWDAQKPSGLIELWDQDDPEPFYLAEEQDEWRIGWDQIKDYWSPKGPSSTEAIRMRFDSVQARLLSPELAFATFWIRFDTKMKFMPKPIGSDTRASAIFRKKPEGWRLITWAESPQSPILYMQKLYEKNTKPGFEEFIQEHGKSPQKP